jgi:hypothetical protein
MDKVKNISKFYTVEDGKLKPLETKQISTKIHYMGYSYNIKFNYSIYKNTIVLQDNSSGAASSTSAYAVPIKNCIDKVLVILSHGSQSNYTEYKMLLNVSTLEITDFLSKCNLSSIDSIREIDMSDDLSNAIIISGNSENDKYYFCDIAKGQITEMKSYVNSELTTCRFIDNDTIFYTKNNGTAFDGFRFDIKTKKTVQVLENSQDYSAETGGIVFCGTYALCVNTNGKAAVLNLKTGKKITISDFVYTKDTDVIVNQDDTRIMFMQFDSTANRLGIKSLGVLNMKSEKLTMLSREGYENRYEVNLSWFDNNRVAIWARAAEYGNDNYLYLYEFLN